jgi:hypothetical protein
VLECMAQLPAVYKARARLLCEWGRALAG